jgi:hypothetical protein
MERQDFTDILAHPSLAVGSSTRIVIRLQPRAAEPHNFENQSGDLSVMGRK